MKVTITVEAVGQVAEGMNPEDFKARLDRGIHEAIASKLVRVDNVVVTVSRVPEETLIRVGSSLTPAISISSTDRLEKLAKDEPFKVQR